MIMKTKRIQVCGVMAAMLLWGATATLAEMSVDQASIQTGVTENCFSAFDDGLTPAVGNSTGGTASRVGTYAGEVGAEVVTFQTGESETPLLKEALNQWVWANLDGVLPLLWDNPVTFNHTFAFTEPPVFEKPVSFGPEVKLEIAADQDLVLNGAGDNALGQLELGGLNTRVRLGKGVKVTAIAALTVKAPLEAYMPGEKVFNNVSMPFDVKANQVPGLKTTAYSSANRAAGGAEVLNPWIEPAGEDPIGWRIALADQTIQEPVSFSSTNEPELLEVINETAAPRSLEYSYGVTGKDADWEAAHFGWNVVNSGRVNPATVRFTDPNLRFVQQPQKNGNYLPVPLVNNTVQMEPYTPYVVQATQPDATMVLPSPVEGAVLDHLFLEVELRDATGAMLDKVFLAVGQKMPGLSLEKFGLGPTSLYVVQDGQKCAAVTPFEHGAALFTLGLSGMNEHTSEAMAFVSGVQAVDGLQLVVTRSTTGNEPLYFNQTPILLGQPFAASAGVLQVGDLISGSERSASSLRFATSNNHLLIEGLQAGEPYKLYTLNGVLVSAGSATGFSERLTLTGQQLYLLHIRGTVHKIIAR
jgi:hypothetical protein